MPGDPYPKTLIHPGHAPAKSKTETEPAAPVRLPPVTVNNLDQEAEYCAKGYLPSRPVSASAPLPSEAECVTFLDPKLAAKYGPQVIRSGFRPSIADPLRSVATDHNAQHGIRAKYRPPAVLPIRLIGLQEFIRQIALDGRSKSFVRRWTPQSVSIAAEYRQIDGWQNPNWVIAREAVRAAFAAGEMKLLLIRNREPRTVEGVQPAFWSLRDPDDVLIQDLILAREQDRTKEWTFALDETVVESCLGAIRHPDEVELAEVMRIEAETVTPAPPPETGGDAPQPRPANDGCIHGAITAAYDEYRKTGRNPPQSQRYYRARKRQAGRKRILGIWPPYPAFG